MSTNQLIKSKNNIIQLSSLGVSCSHQLPLRKIFQVASMRYFIHTHAHKEWLQFNYHINTGWV